MRLGKRLPGAWLWLRSIHFWKAMVTVQCSCVQNEGKEVFINPLKLVTSEHLARWKVGCTAVSQPQGKLDAMSAYLLIINLCKSPWTFRIPKNGMQFFHVLLRACPAPSPLHQDTCFLPISSPCPILASTESSSGERIRGMFLRMTMMVRVKRRS